YGLVVSAVLNDFAACARCFESFYIETLQHVETTKPASAPKWYWPLVFIHISAFRLFRSAKVVFGRGYPLVTYSLLRELKDRGFMFGAIARNEVSLRKAGGWDIQPESPGSFTDSDQKQLVIARKRIDSIIRSQTIGASGFDAQTQAKLKEWNE